MSDLQVVKTRQTQFPRVNWSFSQIFTFTKKFRAPLVLQPSGMVKKKPTLKPPDLKKALKSLFASPPYLHLFSSQFPHIPWSGSRSTGLSMLSLFWSEVLAMIISLPNCHISLNNDIYDCCPTYSSSKSRSSNVQSGRSSFPAPPPSLHNLVGKPPTHFPFLSTSPLSRTTRHLAQHMRIRGHKNTRIWEYEDRRIRGSIRRCITHLSESGPCLASQPLVANHLYPLSTAQYFDARLTRHSQALLSSSPSARSPRLSSSPSPPSPSPSSPAAPWVRPPPCLSQQVDSPSVSSFSWNASNVYFINCLIKCHQSSVSEKKHLTGVIIQIL